MILVDVHRGAHFDRAHLLVQRLAEEPLLGLPQPPHQLDVDALREGAAEKRRIDEEAIPGLWRDIRSELFERRAIGAIDLLQPLERLRAASDVEPDIQRIHRVQLIAAVAHEAESVERAFADLASLIRLGRGVDLLLELMGDNGKHDAGVARQSLQRRRLLHGALDGGAIHVALETREQCRRRHKADLGMARGVPRRRLARHGRVEQRFDTIPHRLRKQALGCGFVNRISRAELAVLALQQRVRLLELV